MSRLGRFQGMGVGVACGVVAGVVAFYNKPTGRGTPEGNSVALFLAVLFWTTIFGLIPAAICGSIGSLIGSLTRRAEAGGFFGLLVAYGASPYYFGVAAALAWTSGVVGGWFGAFEQTRGAGRIETRFRLLVAMIYVAIAAVHLGIFLALRRQG